MDVASIVAAVITFVLGIIIGRVGKVKFTKAAEFVGGLADVIFEMSKFIALASDLVKAFKKAIEDGKVSREEVLEILSTWEKVVKEFEELKESIEDLRQALLVGGGKSGQA